jgi:hypothetical protein
MWYWKLLNFVSFVMPYGCPNDRASNGKDGCRSAKNGRIVTQDNPWRCPTCEEVYRLGRSGTAIIFMYNTGSSAGETIFRIADCPVCKQFHTLYVTRGFGEEGTDYLECLHCGHREAR